MVQRQWFKAPQRSYIPAVKLQRTTCLYISNIKLFAYFNEGAKLRVTGFDRVFIILIPCSSQRTNFRIIYDLRL